jgi:hypothetical protein
VLVLGRLEEIRRVLGLRVYRRVTLLRRPVRVTLHLALHPSLSLSWQGWTANLSRYGAVVRLAVAPGLAYRRILWRPARRGRRTEAQEVTRW